VILKSPCSNLKTARPFFFISSIRERTSWKSSLTFAGVALGWDGLAEILAAALVVLAGFAEGFMEVLDVRAIL